MSVENFNTTDAVPDDPPRILIDHIVTAEQKSNSLNSKHTSKNDNDKHIDDNTEFENKSEKNEKLPKDTAKEQKDRSNIQSSNKKSSKGKKTPIKIPKNTTGVVKIVNIEGSNSVHVGNVYHYTYNQEGSKTNCPDEIDRTYEINRLLESRTIINQEHIDIISRHMGKSWRDIGIRLGYSKGELDNFYEDNKEHGLKEVAYQMLLDWIQVKTDEAILGELMSIMWHLGEKLLVKELSKTLGIR